jgi:hypothetical protein
MKIKSIILLFILPLIASGTEFVVDPRVKSVINSDEIVEPAGDYFRVVLLNSEVDACLRIDRINLRGPKPTVKEQKRYCAFSLNKKIYSLLPDQHQDSDISSVAWKKFELNFNLSYVSTGTGASEMKLKCSVDPRQNQTDFFCTQ